MPDSDQQVVAALGIHSGDFGVRSDGEVLWNVRGQYSVPIWIPS
ncbi:MULTISPECIES: hypothetical protein [unclassified Rhodococcus (in: high G+C Gram-positive bacteria)]|nr:MULTISPECIES: hypothetical protein [unclassified Rhodococcus (in: high G+C Gram-positive bacteria)]